MQLRPTQIKLFSHLVGEMWSTFKKKKINYDSILFNAHHPVHPGRTTHQQAFGGAHVHYASVSRGETLKIQSYETFFNIYAAFH